MTISRRKLMGNCAALVGGLALPKRLLATDEKQASGMRFGLVTYLWGQHMELAELLTSCEASGLLGVELRTEHKHGVEPNLTAAQRADVRRRFADSPVELVGYGSNCEFHASNPETVKANVELAKKYIQLMHDCGGSGVKVKPNGFSKELSKSQTIEQIGNALNEVGEYGQGYGQQVRVEVHGQGTSDLTVVRDIFQVADHPNVTVCWNSNPEDLKGEGLKSNFDMVKNRFGATVHVRELEDRDYPYQDLIGMLSNMNYSGWILLEARGKPNDKTLAMTEQRRIFEQMLSSVH